MKKLISLCVAFALFGAGCFGSSTPTPTPSPETPAPSSSVSSPSTSVNVNASVSSTALTPVDDTWKTYTSRAGDFSFQWPTKGRYAPTWGTSFSDTDCVATENGVDVGSTLTVGSQTFCHQSSISATGETPALLDVYTTKFGSKYIVISFEKKGYSSNTFDNAAYHATLDQIVGTFKMLK